MTMKQINIVNAYQPITKLNSQDLDGYTAKKIYDLMLKIKPLFDFQVQEQNKIYAKHPNLNIEKMGFDIDPNNPNSKLEAEEEAKEIEKELNELAEIEQEIEFERFEVPLGKVQLSGKDIGNLSDFIDFV